MTCKNCDKSLSAEDSFCYSCGAKVINHRLTLNYLFSEFYDRFFSLDHNAIIRTFIALYTKPKEVIDGYINGVRRRYINVAGYVAIAITLTGFQLYVAQKYFPESLEYGDFAGTSKEFMESWMGYVSEYQSIMYLLLIPLYALLSKLVFFDRKKYNYTEHIVIIGYTQAQLSITFAIPIIILTTLGVNTINFYWEMMLLMLVYTGYCLKSLFELSIIQIILKTLLFFGLLIIISIIFVIGVVVFLFAYAYLTGNNPFS